MPHRTTPAAWPVVVAAFAPRERTRALLRSTLPRRRARLTQARTLPAFAMALRAQLVDAAIVEVGAGDGAWDAAALAAGLPSLPFFALVTPLPHDAPLLARAAAVGCADVLVEGVDDAAMADLVVPCGFTSRFARSLHVPPAALRLVTPLQLMVWHSVVGCAGRAVTTGELAERASVSREHLSRSFTANGAPTLKRVIDLVRLCAAAELAKNPAFDVGDVARVLGFASSSHLSSTAQRIVGSRSSSLARLRTADLVERFARMRTE